MPPWARTIVRPPGSSATSTPAPTEAYKLANDRPVSIAVPRLHITAPVVPVGLTKGGAMAVPPGPEIAGWFKIGTYPGDQGSAVIAGHSGFARRSAAFDPLTKVRKGDVVQVRTSMGKTLTFSVIGQREYPADSTANEVFSRNDGVYLNLVSCTGSWNSTLGTHSQRLVVFTRLAQ
jgi:sortase A